MGPRRVLHVLLAVLLAVTVVSLASSALSASGVGSVDGGPDRTLVVTIDGTGPGQIVAYGPDGTRLYRNRTWALYHDVDPSPVGDRTVTYVASDPAADDRCGGDRCLRNVIERVNLTTGEVTRLHTTVTNRSGSSQIHDVDRVNESVWLVADISFPDRVYMVNTTTDEVIWEWRVAEAFDADSGGSYPGDWTHVNDVEYLPDGRVMVNLRNQDQVVFVRPGEGVQTNWTLGRDNQLGTLFEPHNPDYVPRERGGPAVVIADSENNRLVEYERENGSWRRTWVWADSRMQWPRDADRLPSGRTLVVDTHGSRLLLLNRTGGVAWATPFPDGAYDAELLGTGDESAGGPSATRAELASRRPAAGSDPVYRVVSAVPPLVLHGLLFALPTWTGAVDAVVLLATGGVTLLTLAVEVGVRCRDRLR